MPAEREPVVVAEYENYPRLFPYYADEDRLMKALNVHHAGKAEIPYDEEVLPACREAHNRLRSGIRPKLTLELLSDGTSRLKGVSDGAGAAPQLLERWAAVYEADWGTDEGLRHAADLIRANEEPPVTVKRQEAAKGSDGDVPR